MYDAVDASFVHRRYRYHQTSVAYRRSCVGVYIAYHAVHPVLLLSLRRQNKEIIPLDITLDRHARILEVGCDYSPHAAVIELFEYCLGNGSSYLRFGAAAKFVDRQKEKKLENQLSRYEDEAEQLREKRREILNDAKEEARKILEGSNASIERTIHEIIINSHSSQVNLLFEVKLFATLGVRYSSSHHSSRTGS